jgi:DNA replication protein DnaC
MRLPRRFWEADFARISEGDHKLAIGKYVAKIVVALKKGFGMVLWGQNGTGKTAAAAVCLKEARRRGVSCLFITANQFITDTISRAPFNDAHTVHQRAKMVDLLVLDDLGKETYAHDMSKDTVESMFEDLLRHRSANMRSTIITMNLGPSKLEEKYGKSFTRVMQESNPFVEMVGPSQREAGKEELVKFFSE